MGGELRKFPFSQDVQASRPREWATKLVGGPGRWMVVDRPFQTPYPANMAAKKEREGWRFIRPRNDHYICFYLPTKDQDRKLIGVDSVKLIHATMSFMLLELGGATMTEGVGYYLGEGDVIHKEDVTMCKSFCSVDALERHGPEINRLANSMCIEFKQESLTVEVDGEMFFFKPSPKYKARYEKLRKDYLSKKKDPTGYQLYIDKSLDLDL